MLSTITNYTSSGTSLQEFNYSGNYGQCYGNNAVINETMDLQAAIKGLKAQNAYLIDSICRLQEEIDKIKKMWL